MKKEYQAPALEIEIYELNASLAANCGQTITMGPAYGSYSACAEFNRGGIDWQSLDTSFYDLTDVSGGNVCNCYYQAGGEGYFTS